MCISAFKAALKPLVQLLSKPAKAMHPPEAEVEVLGYIRDLNGCSYARDIGLSFKIAGDHHFYFFGDTFCKDHEGNFVGLSHNTAAYIPNILQPLECAYPRIDEKGVVEPLLRLTDGEKASETDNRRIALWHYGGFVHGEWQGGWMWYQKVEVTKDPMSMSFLGVGLAYLALFNDDDDGAIPRLQATRMGDGRLDWGPDEPMIGSISAVPNGKSHVIEGIVPAYCLVPRPVSIG